MMIPMISIDGLSGSVVRDGPGITQTQAMCLGMLVGQNKECGEAFEAAVEKFQQMMAEGLSGESGIPGYSGISGYSGESGESGISGDEAPRAVTTAVPHVVVEVPVAVAASVTTQQVATSATLPLEGVVEKPVVVEKVVTSVAAERPVKVEKAVTPVAIEVPVAVAASATTQQVATSATLPPEGVAEKPVVAERPVKVEKVVTPVAVEVPVAVEKVVTPVMAEVPVAVAASATLPLEGTPEKSPKGNGVLAADEIVERKESTSSDDPEPQVIDFRNVLIQPSQGGVDGVAIEKRVFTPAQVLVDAAAAVADTITVSPEVLRGAGEIEVQLRSDVLEGTVIRISTTEAGKMNIQFTPATAEVAALLEKCAPQLVAYLSERVHGFSVSVNVKRDDKLKG